eukprot:804887-Alexandrium_andersonii.AAC.1
MELRHAGNIAAQASASLRLPSRHCPSHSHVERHQLGSLSMQACPSVALQRVCVGARARSAPPSCDAAVRIGF